MIEYGLFDFMGSVVQYKFMYTQRQQQKIKTIDLNQYLDGFHNYRTIANDRETIKSHPFTLKLKNHIKQRAETCFSNQAFHPPTRSTNRTTMQNRYSKDSPLQEEHYKDLQNINIDQFMHAICNKDNLRQNSHNTHEFIRSLNGTWFQGTNQQFKCSKIFNTLGIKKNRSFNKPRSERFNYQQNPKDKIDLNKQFRHNGLFPSRKTNMPLRMKMPKSPLFSHLHQSPTKNNEGCLKLQIVNSIKNEIHAKPNSRVSSRGHKHNIQAVAGNFNNEKIIKKMNQDGVVKGKKMVIHQ